MSYQPTPAALAGRALLGRRIRILREERHLTQEKLATLAGMDRSFLADVENGHHSCMADRLFDIAAAMEVAAADLMGEPSES